MKARDLAWGKWRSILPKLGIPEEFLDGRHHSCPNGGGKDRFRFADRNGSGNFFCACSRGEKGGLGLVMCCRNLGYQDACKEVERVLDSDVLLAARPRMQRDPRRALNRVRKLLQPAGFTVQRYLHERGLKPAPGLRQARLSYWEDGKSLGVFTTMVGLIQAANGSPRSYHLTYLDGVAKASVPSPRKIMTPVDTITGGAVRIYPQAAHLGIAEGIETAIAAHMMTGLSVWAALNAHGVENFQPPSGVQTLTVFADNDTSFTGQAAAYALAKRMQRQSIACAVEVAPFGDWNDCLIAREIAS